MHVPSGTVRDGCFRLVTIEKFAWNVSITVAVSIVVLRCQLVGEMSLRAVTIVGKHYLAAVLSVFGRYLCYLVEPEPLENGRIVFFIGITLVLLPMLLR